MNDDQAEGNFKQMKGKAKEAWGKVTDNEATEAEGAVDKLSGKVQETIGDVKGAFRKGAEDAEQHRIEEREDL